MLCLKNRDRFHQDITCNPFVVAYICELTALVSTRVAGVCACVCVKVGRGKVGLRYYLF